MFQGTPEQRLWLANQRQVELIHEAEQYRLATASRDESEPAEHLSTRLVSRIRAGLGRPFASVQRALSGHEAPCDDTCPDGVPC
jgi:hypothetical protein